MTANLKSGDIVNIYIDPFTEHQLEGRAKLINFYEKESDETFEVWGVRFIDLQNEPWVMRKIKRK